MSVQSSYSADISWRAASAAQAGALMALREESPQRPAVAEARQDVPLDELSFHALQTPQEIEAIKYLRNELSLPGSALADPAFQSLEKKETKTGWWELSHAAANSWGRSASYR